MNVFFLPVIRYPTAVLKWPQEETKPTTCQSKKKKKPPHDARRVCEEVK